MAAPPLRLELGDSFTRRAFAALCLTAATFTATTAAFVVLWARADDLGPRGRWALDYILVQAHLGTENVVAAWYSSMLLLLVALFALLAFVVDRRRGRDALGYGWLAFAAAFAVLSFDEIGSLHERLGVLAFPDGPRDRAAWVHLLALPIVLVAAFMIAFAWSRLRAVPRALALVTTGVVLFLLNPALEVVEMALIHGPGARPGTWARHAHDILLVLEEGGLELFGTLAFLAAVVTYVRPRGGDSIEWVVPTTARVRTIRAVVVISCLGTIASPAIVTRLPAADTGLPQNWFPAAAWLLVSLASARRSRLASAASAAISAAFGASLYGYSAALSSMQPWHVPLAGVLTAGVALEALTRFHARTSAERSPRSTVPAA